MVEEISLKSEKLYWLDLFFVFLLHIYPVFALSINKSASILFFVTALIATVILVRDRELYEHKRFSRETWLVIIMFASLPFAVFVAQLLRLHIVARNFDAPIRLLLAIPILLVIYRKKLPATDYFVRMIPATLLVLLIQVSLWPDPKWGGRVTTYFVDPLTFGSTTLLLGTLSLVAIPTLKTKRILSILVYFLTFVVGVYLSALSGSRTGWLALPFVLLAWGWWRFTVYSRLKWLVRGMLFILIFIGVAGGYALLPNVKNRCDTAILEVREYSWNRMNDFTSVGARISFYRMAAELVIDNPLRGYADEEIKEVIYKESFRRFSTKEASDAVVFAGFHNEFLTNSVRSGVWGVFATFALYCLPLWVIGRRLYSLDESVRSFAMIALGYVVFFVVSGFTTEILNLKYVTSLHAMMMAVLYGSLLWNETTPVRHDV